MEAEVEAVEEDSFLEKARMTFDENMQINRRNKLWRSTALTCIMIIFFETALMLGFWYIGKAEPNQYETGFDTDLGTFQSAIKLTRTRFSSPIHADSTGKLHLVSNSENKRYIGEPFEEVDRNWDDLIADRYFPFSEEEQRQALPKTWTTQSANNITDAFNAQGVFGGVDMFHSLHCLDSLRRSLGNRSYQAQTHRIQQSYTRLHIDHCVEQIRQAILCHGDLTPVTLVPAYDEENKVLNIVGQTEYLHTCRDWQSLLERLHSRGHTHADS